MGSVRAGQAIWQEDRARLIVQAVVGIIAPRLEALIGPDLWAMDARDMELWVRDLLRQAGAAIATELLRVAAEHHMSLVRPTCATCEHPLHLAQRAAPRTLVGLTGDTITYERAVFRCPDGHERIAPVDAILGIGPGHLLPALLEAACVAGITDPFRDGVRLLEAMLGAKVPRSTLAPSVEAIGHVAEAEVLATVANEAAHEHPPTPSDALPPPGDGGASDTTFVLVEMDGARIHVDGAWREDKLGMIAPLRWARGKEDDTVKLRPDTQTYVASLEEADPFYERVKAMTCLSLPPPPAQAEVITVNDGAPWIWNRVDLLRPLASAVHEVADFWHACEHLEKVAEMVYPSNDARRREWFAAARHGLRTRGPDDALERLRALPARGKKQRHLRDTTIQYFVDRADRMHYPEYEARGWPIGSGVIESTCEHVAGTRLKNPGMRWSYGGAQAMLSLRALYRSGQDPWAAFWQGKPQLRKPRLRDVTYRKYAKAA